MTITNLVSKIFSRQSKIENIFRNGKWKEHNRLGILVREGFYKNGLKHGLWKIYSDASGQPVIEEEYTDGILHGHYKSFHENGTIFSIGQYKFNKRDGEFKVYDRSGILKKIMRFRDDILLEVTEKCEPRSLLA